ncbi:MAG: oligoendopeptidase F [Thermoclostridium sp.]|nr:oligoendopeptidase F [Thermoclostridium sp.]
MANQQTLPKRNELDPDYKWRLEDIYESNEAWKKDVEKARELLSQLLPMRGTLGETAEKLFQCLKLQDELMSIHDKVLVYARMRRDEDNSDPLYQDLTETAFSLSTEIGARLSFITPEIIGLPDGKLINFLNENEDLAVYRFSLEELLRQKKHILSAREEEIMALTAEMARNPRDTFTMFNNADMKFPFIKDEQGQEVELTKGRYIRFLESDNREVRKQAYEAMYTTYGKMKNTLGATLSGNIKKNRFFSTVRNYTSSLELSLDQDNVPTQVYDNLIDTIHKNLPLLHRYLKLRKKALKLDDLRMYDLYCPMVSDIDRLIPYHQAIGMVKEGLKPLGKRYIEDLSAGLDSAWVDVYENEGKTSGAYSWGAYTTHPYVLLNYQGTINDVFTLAHEMGHAMHTFYTNQTQPYVYSGYKIFVAEVASTVNESLLMHHLLETTQKKEERAYLLNHYLEEFRGTVFRQVMFAEFEKIVHDKAEKGESITTSELCSIYKGLNDKFFGEEVAVDDLIAMEWARIPHFYTSFYVYKYATGFSSAASLSSQILRDGEPAVERYLNFLKSGCSDYPLELLKKAGVDLTTPQPIQNALDVFGKTLDELEAIL